MTMPQDTLGTKLLALKERSGLSLATIARSGGYKNASSIQRYFDPIYDADFLQRPIANKLKAAFIGFGEPVITETDIEELTEFGYELGRQDVGFTMFLQPRKLTYAIECNATYPLDIYIEEAEVFSIGEDPSLAFEKYDGLAARPMNALYVSTASMSPRYNIGEIIFYEEHRPAPTGEDVIVMLSGYEVVLVSAILGRLVGQSRQAVELEIYNPPGRITLDRSRVEFVCPLVPASDLLRKRSPGEHTQTP